MKKIRRAGFASVLCAMLLAIGCGGGGGGGGWLTFSPSSIDISTYADEPVEFQVTATSTRTIGGVINVGIVDTRGVIDSNATTVDIDGYTAAANLRTASDLPVGVYTGALEVRLCRDNPAVCAQPIEGSPWRLPYNIKVLAATNLTPLTALPGAGDWATYQGNAAHTGFVNTSVQLQPANFTRRWAVATEQIGSLATMDGTVVRTPSYDLSGAVVAVAEHDGTERWRYGGNSVYSGVATGEGRVWFVEKGVNGAPAMALRGLGGADGSVQVEVLLSPYDTPVQLAPVVADGSVFAAGTSYATVDRYRATDGATQWTNFGSGASAWYLSPSVGGGRVVLWDLQRLSIADATTGISQGPIDGPDVWGISTIWNVWGAPVLSSGPLAFVSAYEYFTSNGMTGNGGRLVAFDVDTRTVAWYKGTTVRSNPVLAGSAVYVTLTDGTLQAHDATTGAPLWHWTPPDAALISSAGTPRNQPILVVGNLVFIGRNRVTYAIDLTTRKSVWSYPAAGPMAVSANGTLFIAALNRLHAINLR